jgi:hypothetical protein
MTKQAIADLSMALTGYIIALHRAPTPHELEQFITKFIRSRSKGKLLS